MQQTKTFLLIAGLTALFVTIGTLLAGRAGMYFALMFALIMNLSMYWFSADIVLNLYRAKPIRPDDVKLNWLYRLVEELAINGRLPTPAVYLIEDDTPNAFATGRNPEHACIAVTSGLLQHLSSEEVRGVLGHELAHVQHRHTLLNTLSATLAGAISSVVNMAMWANLLGHERDNQHPFAGLLAMIFAPMAAALIQFAISRSCEFEADAGGAKLCGNAQPLIAALTKLEQANKVQPSLTIGNHPSTAHLFIVNPLTTGSSVTELFSTHPPMSERIARLQALMN